MDILIVSEPVSGKTLEKLARAWHFVLVKGVADIERGIVARLLPSLGL